MRARTCEGGHQRCVLRRSCKLTGAAGGLRLAGRPERGLGEEDGASEVQFSESGVVRYQCVGNGGQGTGQDVKRAAWIGDRSPLVETWGPLVSEGQDLASEAVRPPPGSADDQKASPIGRRSPVFANPVPVVFVTVAAHVSGLPLRLSPHGKPHGRWRKLRSSTLPTGFSSEGLRTPNLAEG